MPERGCPQPQQRPNLQDCSNSHTQPFHKSGSFHLFSIWATRPSTRGFATELSSTLSRTARRLSAIARSATAEAHASVFPLELGRTLAPAPTESGVWFPRPTKNRVG